MICRIRNEREIVEAERILELVETELAQIRVNERWLLALIDEIHDALCPDQSGTWQQRAEQAVQAAQQRAGKSSATPCIWTENEDGVWETTCGEMFTFIDGGPTANGARFCCYCGRALREAKFMAEKRKKRRRHD